MSDETTTRSDEPTSERVGFCQDCGKPLNKETVRSVGTGVFCEPCLHARLTASQNPAAAVPPPGATGYTAPAPAPSYAGEPHPWLAGLLGLIPGVGAMYNGQFAKGIAHLVVFAVLVSLANHVSDVFGLFVFGWICYMAIEAYHTARARRDGLPLPNPFGLNDIGEKMGFGKSWGSMAQTRPPVPPTPPPPAATPGTATSVPAPSANWFGYVPPAQGTGYAAGTGNAPYVAPVPPTPYSTPYSAPQVPPPMPGMPLPPMPAPGSSFPLIAVWLIGLGVLFTLAEWVPSWHVNGPSLVAIMLGALAASIIVRRLGYMGGMNYHGPVLHMMRWPMILVVLAVLFLLQGVHAATLGQTWPVILLALGAVLLGERMGLGTQPYPQSYPAPAQDSSPVIVTPPPAGEAATAADAAQQTAEQFHQPNSDERDGYSR